MIYPTIFLSTLDDSYFLNKYYLSIIFDFNQSTKSSKFENLLFGVTKCYFNQLKDSKEYLENVNFGIRKRQSIQNFINSFYTVLSNCIEPNVKCFQRKIQFEDELSNSTIDIKIISHKIL